MAITPTPKRGPVSQTLAQAANARANQQLNPQIAAQNAFNAHQTAVIQQFANALLGKLQPVAGQVGGDYDAAIKQIGSLSGQASQYFSGQNPAGSQQQLLSSVGAPAEQQAQSSQALSDTFQGGAGVLAFTGGTIPGSQLATDKAAAQSQAAQLPGIAALKGQQDLSSALWQQGQDRKTLLATRPGLVQQATQDIRTNNAARATARQKQAAADFLQWYKTQGLNQTQQKIDAKAAEFGVTSSISQQNANASTTRASTGAASAAETARHHAVTETQGEARIRIAKQKAAAAAATKVGANKEFPNLSKSQVLHLRAGVNTAFYGNPNYINPVTQKLDPLPPLDYQDAISHMIAGGYSRAGATKMANHFYMPGKRGRPPLASQSVNPKVNPNAAGPPAP